MRNNPHPSDQDLLLASDGDLSAGRARQLEEHLAQCDACRARRETLENAQSDFVEATHLDPISGILPAGEARAMLRSRLAEAAARNETRAGLALTLSAIACALVLLAVSIAGYRHIESSGKSGLRVVSVPNRSLTPGVAMQISKDAVCTSSPAKNRMVPVALRRQVFEEYGIQRAEPQAYEVDYLITPALGGADDIRNLWPQSYSSTVWNARVKDALEDRLHDLVCDGQLDLKTAQRDIAADWVGAYKKYFHTDKPLAIQ
jgi:anti-sigma factor ChrR (cupin superfamily)